MTKELIDAGALRQLRHNDGSEGFVFAYDRETTDREFASLKAAQSTVQAQPVAPQWKDRRGAAEPATVAQPVAGIVPWEERVAKAVASNPSLARDPHFQASQESAELAEYRALAASQPAVAQLDPRDAKIAELEKRCSDWDLTCSTQALEIEHLREQAQPAVAQADEELDHGETVLRVQKALGITDTGWVDPSVILHRIAALAARKPAAPEGKLEVEISHRLRKCALGHMPNQEHAKLMLTAADEIERYYGGMLNWKRTAEAKDVAHARTTWALRQVARMDPKTDTIGTAMFVAREAFAAPAIPAQGERDEFDTWWDSVMGKDAGGKAFAWSVWQERAGRAIRAAQVQPVAAPEDVRNSTLEEIAIECEQSADRFIGNTEKGSGWREALYHFASLARDKKSLQQADGKDGA